ncbi:MAG: hypothetical protein ABL986_14275 [Vicinamibacterales bacterium]
MANPESWSLLQRLRSTFSRLVSSPANRPLTATLDELRTQAARDARWRTKLEHKISVLGEQQKTLLREARMQRREEARWRWRFRQQLDAQMRQHAVAGTGLISPHWLEGHRFRLRSQNEEDGILLALLRAAGARSRTFVEIGCGKSGGNSAILAFEFGWSGLMVDAGGGKIDVLRRMLAHSPGVVAVKSFVTPDNFNSLLTEHGFVGDIDFMSIDIDSVDYWLLDVLEVCSPRILVMEYNAGFGPNQSVTLPASLAAGPLPSGYAGASLTALEKCAQRKGFGLVLCETNGINAFFLRNDVAPEIPRLTPVEAFRTRIRKLDGEQDAPDEDLIASLRARGFPLVEV